MAGLTPLIFDGKSAILIYVNRPTFIMKHFLMCVSRWDYTPGVLYGLVI